MADSTSFSASPPRDSAQPAYDSSHRIDTRVMKVHVFTNGEHLLKVELQAKCLYRSLLMVNTHTKEITDDLQPSNAHSSQLDVTGHAELFLTASACTIEKLFVQSLNPAIQMQCFASMVLRIQHLCQEHGIQHLGIAKPKISDWFGQLLSPAGFQACYCLDLSLGDGGTSMCLMVPCLPLGARSTTEDLSTAGGVPLDGHHAAMKQEDADDEGSLISDIPVREDFSPHEKRHVPHSGPLQNPGTTAAAALKEPPSSEALLSLLTSRVSQGPQPAQSTSLDALQTRINNIISQAESQAARTSMVEDSHKSIDATGSRIGAQNLQPKEMEEELKRSTGAFVSRGGSQVTQPHKERQDLQRSIDDLIAHADSQPLQPTPLLGTTPRHRQLVLTRPDTQDPLPGDNALSRGTLGRKIYCVHWLKTGECNYMQQGCRYKHEIPDDQETWAKLGIRSTPRWLVESDDPLPVMGNLPTLTRVTPERGEGIGQRRFGKNVQSGRVESQELEWTPQPEHSRSHGRGQNRQSSKFPGPISPAKREHKTSSSSNEYSILGRGLATEEPRTLESRVEQPLRSSSHTRYKASHPRKRRYGWGI